jgi:hypothetical protein
MQKALGDDRGSRRRLRDKTSVDLQTEDHVWHVQQKRSVTSMR